MSKKVCNLLVTLFTLRIIWLLRDVTLFTLRIISLLRWITQHIIFLLHWITLGLTFVDFDVLVPFL